MVNYSQWMNLNVTPSQFRRIPVEQLHQPHKVQNISPNTRPNPAPNSLKSRLVSKHPRNGKFQNTCQIRIIPVQVHHTSSFHDFPPSFLDKIISLQPPATGVQIKSEWHNKCYYGTHRHETSQPQPRDAAPWHTRYCWWKKTCISWGW